ncbi:sporulation related protein [Humitalea rosea]|uniref:Sporulation related protein n=1 Tax=Humitalea rosea TaxID=990373 RepID=A0A2W7J2K4_9PROT|nr:lytic transglycosylase domain-containing protein [Humitalea rosea]PZW45867.1 sporulation related protein [Humitalea rosea]
MYRIQSCPSPKTWFSAGGAWRSALLVGLLGLAACGSQPRQVSPSFAAGGPSRPSSYDPPGPPGDPWGPYIAEASQRFDVPQRWIREVMRQESAGRTTATSPVGAMGLMQVMPATYSELRARHGLGSDPYHPWDSIMAGTAYLRQMYDLYGSPAFLAAYNAGPRRLEDYLWNGRGLPAETRNYVARIGPRVVDASPRRRAAPEIYAAAEIPLSIPSGPRRMDRSTMLALREQRENLDPGIQVATLPPGPVVAMAPIPDGSTYASTPLVSSGYAPAGSLLSAAAPAEAPARQFADARLAPTMRMEPIVSPGDLAPQPAPVTAESLPPPPAAAPAPRAATVLASAAPAAAPRGFRLVPTASADTLPGGLQAVLARHAPQPQAQAQAQAQSETSWAVQVGAFGSERLARGAASRARSAVPVAQARALVMPVSQGRSTLWRARVTGLSRVAAEAACGRLRAQGACMVLTPDAQG